MSVPGINSDFFIYLTGALIPTGLETRIPLAPSLDPVQDESETQDADDDCQIGG